jgi:hypothetical protein
VSEYYTHVNRNVIDSNRKNGRNDPPVRFQKGKYGKSIYCHEVRLPEGSRMVYDHEGTILPCGARLVIVSDVQPEVVR